jgi:hypothetical protein
LSDQKYFYLNRRVLESSLGKLLVEISSGKTNLGGLIRWLDNLDFVFEIEDLVNGISSKFTFFDSASRKCSVESIARPELIREDEIGLLLGYKCVSCGKTESAMAHRYIKNCGRCGDKLKLSYLLAHKKLRDLNVIPTPEAVLMSVAWETLAEAYIQGYSALQKVLSALVEHYGLTVPFEFVSADLKDRLDSIFYYYDPGDVRMATEEREILMALIRGVLAKVGLAEMTAFIRAGMNVCKFGNLSNKLFCSGADAQYEFARAEFSALYNPLNAKIREALVISRKDREQKVIVEMQQLEDKQYFPCALLPKETWSSGKLARSLILKPLEKSKLPVFSDDENVAMNCFISPSGGGKTTFLGGVIDNAINWGGEYVLSILGDEKNGLSLSGIPLFPCEGHTGDLLEILAEMGVPPQRIPCLNLALIRDDVDQRKYLDNSKNSLPPTIYSRIIEIDDPCSFGLKFKTSKKATVESKGVVGDRGLLNILEEFALKLGYPRMCGLINVLNLLRKESGSSPHSEYKPDIEIGTELLYKFLSFRQENKFPSARLYIDELSRFAPITHSVAGTDTSKAASSFNEAIKAMRGMNTSVDTATQKWNEVHPEAKSEAFNIFFRNLSKQSDKSHSQRDLVLGSLDLIDGDSERAVVNRILESKQFPPNAHFWFWYNKLAGKIDVIRPNPPRFMLNQPKKTNLQVFKAYEAFSHEKILLDSWDDVPHLRYEADEYFRGSVSTA